MHPIEVKPLPRYLKAADDLLRPAMRWLGNNEVDSEQETHPWHAQPIDPDTIDLSTAVFTLGSDESTHNNQHLPFFHAPRFGGWKKYTTYEAKRRGAQFYIGWIALDNDSWSIKESAIHRLPIDGSRIRTLDGPIGHAAFFFAVSEDGSQIPLRKVGHGQLGDNQYPTVRLF